MTYIDLSLKVQTLFQDEPAIKATFDITLIIPQNRVGLSNMPVVKEENLENNLKLLKFDRSPVMSTYLVAVVVGEYDYVEGKSDDGVLVRVYTPVGKKEQGQFALEVTIKVLPYYKDYFQIAYPLPKMDLIAISDFSAGAMGKLNDIKKKCSVIKRRFILKKIGVLSHTVRRWSWWIPKTLHLSENKALLSPSAMRLLINGLAILLQWNGGQ